MCEFCRKYLCPSCCPSFVGHSAELGRVRFRCTGCGKRLYEDDDYIIDYGKPYCLSCKSINNTQEKTKMRAITNTTYERNHDKRRN